jgi:hypothetical protein
MVNKPNMQNMKAGKIILYIVIVYSIYSIAIAIIEKNQKSDCVESNGNSNAVSERSYNFTRLKINNLVLIDTRGQKINICDMSEKVAKVLFSYNEMDCKSCIYSYLQVLDKTFSADQVIVLSKINDHRALKFQQKDFEVNLNFYKNDKYKCTLDSLKSPFLAVVYGGNTLEYIYMPSMEKHEEYKQVLELYSSFFK